MLRFRFNHAYTTSPIDDSRIKSSKLPVFRFDDVEGERAKTPLKIEVLPDSPEPWIGIFEGDTPSREAITGVFTHPDESTVMVVSAGLAYVVSVTDPGSWFSIPYVPITNILDVPELNLIVLSDFLQVAGYDKNGLRWKTPRLSYDGIRFERIQKLQLLGEAWSAPWERYLPFKVDLTTGQHSGGARPHRAD